MLGYAPRTWFFIQSLARTMLTRVRFGRRVGAGAAALALSGCALGMSVASSETGVSGSFTETAKLIGKGQIGKATFGSAVALSADGRTALVGGVNDNRRIGAAWVFVRIGDQWTQQGPKLVPPGKDWPLSEGWGRKGSAGGFGSSVALSADGSTALIGGPGTYGGRGAAWVYARTGTAWSLQKRLVAGGESDQGAFGYSVALSANGNTALIGGDQDGWLTRGRRVIGAVWTFTRTGSDWGQVGKKFTLTAHLQCAGVLAHNACDFGNAVALSADGKTALISNDGNTNAYAYTWNGAAWKHQATFAGEGPTQVGCCVVVGSGSEFGDAVALSNDGNTAVILGSPMFGPGKAYVFERTGTVWRYAKALFSKAEQNIDESGESVALSGDGQTALMTGDYIQGDYPAAAWAFVRNGARWVLQNGKLTAANRTGPKIGAMTVALSDDGHTALVGGGTQVSLYDGSGRVWVYTR
jgi:hypothetical protein